MTLPLPRHHCERFMINSDFTISSNMEPDLQGLIQPTLNYIDPHAPDDETVGLFSSRYKTDDVDCRVFASLRFHQVEDELNGEVLIIYEHADDERYANERRPTSAFRFIDRLTALFGDMDTHVHASFRYARAQGFRSRVPLPIPLMIPEGTADGLTHVDSVEFSSRDDDSVQYQIFVAGHDDDSGSFRHGVHLTPRLELHRRSIRQVFDRSRAISSRLIIPTERD